MADNLDATKAERQISTLAIYSSHGLWLVRSTAASCWLDLDAGVLIRWPPGVNAAPTEVPLIAVLSVDVGDHDTIRVGDRHQYVTDPFPDQLAMSYQMWVQDTVTLIAPATEISLDA
ncbi:MAG: hypothetical protein HGA44_00155 [Cellulomonadaceae bacterium]|nr:hypothetical protein [Cellulomonadaceae bacterium]